MRHLTAIATPVLQPHLRVPLMLFFGLVLLLAQTVSVHAAPAPESFSDLVDKVSAAVVNITTTTKVATSASDQPETGTPNDLFREFQNRQRAKTHRGVNRLWGRGSSSRPMVTSSPTTM